MNKRQIALSAPLAFAYIRCSTDEQKDSRLGLEAQNAKIDAFCKHAGIHLTAHYEEAAVSGSVPLKERPCGATLLERLEHCRRTGATLIVAKLDRLFRSVADAAHFIEVWSKSGVALVSLYENFDMTTPYGKAMAQLTAVFAELERSLIRERTREALKAARRMGHRYCGDPPYGWDHVPSKRTTRDGKATCDLAPNRAEQKGLTLIRQLVNKKFSMRAIAHELNLRGIPSKNGGQWAHSSIQSIMRRLKEDKEREGEA